MILATGKARPAAIAACKLYGLEGRCLLEVQGPCVPRGSGVEIVASLTTRYLSLSCTSLAPCAGDNLLVSSRTPGLFLQGLAVHGSGGVQLSDAQLPLSVVRDAFRSGDYLLGSPPTSAKQYASECIGSPLSTRP